MAKNADISAGTVVAAAAFRAVTTIVDDGAVSVVHMPAPDEYKVLFLKKFENS